MSGGERAGAARAGARRARAGTHGGTVAYPARLISGSELDPSPGVTLLGRRSRLLLLRAEELRPRVHASAPAQIGARWGRAGAAGEVRLSCAGVTGLAMSSSMPTNTRPHPPHCAISRLLSGLRNTEYTVVKILRVVVTCDTWTVGVGPRRATHQRGGSPADLVAPW